MKFEKNVMFLGQQANRLSDGSIYHTFQFYDQDSGPVNVNVGGANKDVLAQLDGLKFGTPLTVCFALKPKDKAWRITIDHVCV